MGLRAFSRHKKEQELEKQRKEQNAGYLLGPSGKSYCGYIGTSDPYFWGGWENYKSLSATYTPSNNGEFCNNQYNSCEQALADTTSWRHSVIGGQPYIAIPDNTAENLKRITDEHLFYVAQLVVNEMEARGYGSKKN